MMQGGAMPETKNLTAEGRAAALDQWTSDNFGFLTPSEHQMLRDLSRRIIRRSKGWSKQGS